MPNIKCKACGRRYSYHNSDLCPHCGAYNRPPHRMRVDFDKDGKAELLNEKEFFRQSKAGRQREKACYERKECHEEQVRVSQNTIDVDWLRVKVKQYGEKFFQTEDGELPDAAKAVLIVLAIVLGAIVMC